MKQLSSSLFPDDSLKNMLRVQARRQATQPFVCWKCFTRSRSKHAGLKNTRNPRAKSVREYESYTEGRQLSNAGHIVNSRFTKDEEIPDTGHTARSTPDPISPPQPPPPPDLPGGIRDRLRQWENENAASHESVDFSSDRPLPGSVANSIVHPNYTIFEETEEDAAQEMLSGLDYDTFDMVDVGDSRGFFLPGDLVELKQELAIFVRDLGSQSQFYTISGRWMHQLTHKIVFFVPGFVSPEELDVIRPYLPDGEVDASMEGRLQSFQDSVAIEIGKPLRSKMIEFWEQANATYQRAANLLDNAHKTVADVSKFTYATLEDIAGKILRNTVERDSDGKYPWGVLYAVHRTILQDDIGFKALSHLSTQRVNTQYEINSLNEVDNIRRVVGWVRAYSDAKLTNQSRATKPHRSHLDSFAANARKLIDISRNNRPYTPYGMIGPSAKTSAPGENFRSGVAERNFTVCDLHFIRFLESWVCLESFNADSSLNGVGSAILRAINKYQDARLDRSTGWTCLQELGALPPWDTVTGFELRLPFNSRPDLIQQRSHPAPKFENGVVPDKLKDLRKDWGDTPIYCIDDTAAHEIDDGISLEPTHTADEYWINIHTADPAAHLDPAGKVVRFAEALSETIYLPDRVIPMFQPDYVQAHWSISPNKPCLTFSARMNLRGELLETKIEPGLIQNVQFLTPATFNDVVSDTPAPSAHNVLVAGTLNNTRIASRALKTADQFSEAEKQQMKIIDAIAKARTEILRSKGGISTAHPKPQVSVSFDGFEWARPKSTNRAHQYFGDPTICLHVEKLADGNATAYEAFSTVAACMILAGDVAARWCKERNIPVPYRITPLNPEKQNPQEFFLKKIKNGAREADGSIPIDTMMEYYATIGKVQPSVYPGPHAALALEGFVKVTSPLRRYGDLAAHFQIEAALLEEAKTGKSLVGSISHDYLAIPATRLEKILPRIAGREKRIAAMTSKNIRLWSLQLLVRAWKFGETELPKSLEFAVRSINAASNSVGGVVSQLLIGGKMEIPFWTKAEDIKIGDRFEVEIQHINAFVGYVNYKPIRPLESEAEMLAKKVSALAQ
ncbi:hypothetical protein QTJ16_002767 [Diplocarpon rosae]|uniref:RNB domain-containing protein n=1 Tax=Diplocarpon rosae TaxID=946125 RepID=A0AAD9T2M9_9HELO|nr:hypothetical protein QTJ16_002767 [Diplocarpon rosae]